MPKVLGFHQLRWTRSRVVLQKLPRPKVRTKGIRIRWRCRMHVNGHWWTVQEPRSVSWQFFVFYALNVHFQPSWGVRGHYWVVFISLTGGTFLIEIIIFWFIFVNNLLLVYFLSPLWAHLSLKIAKPTPKNDTSEGILNNVSEKFQVGSFPKILFMLRSSLCNLL